MFQDKMVLCASSAYEKKFYLNENFEGLPQHVKDELKIMCVLFTEDVGGVLSLEFDENGKEKNRYEYNPDWHLMKTAILNSIHLPMKAIFFMMRSAVC